MGQKPAKLTKPWADSPFALIESPPHRTGKTSPRYSATGFATEMALIHNHIIRMLNCIYLQAPNVSLPQDIKDFTTFTHAWILFIREHHETEEAYGFPWMEEYVGIPNYMQQNVEQHHTFEAGLEELAVYVKGLRDSTEVYDGNKIRRIIDSFGKTLEVHLSEEVLFIERMEELGDKVDWQALSKRVSDHAIKTADTEFAVPILLVNGDVTFEDGLHASFWPPFPWFVSYIIRWVHLPKQKGAWRFACSDTYGVPRDLLFVDAET